MKIRSARFRDQKEKPLDRAIWWINWALRNPEPDHMTSPVLKLGFIRANCYDIIGVTVFLGLVVVYVTAKIICICQSKINRKAKRD